MGVWLGGLVLLFGALLPSDETEVIRELVPDFSRAAVCCVATLVATGAYQGWRQIGSPAGLVTTSYGWLLLGKLAVVVLLVGLGAASRSWVRRRCRGGRSRSPRGTPARQELARFRSLVATEAGLAVVVLAVTASLVASMPARSVQLQVAVQQRVSEQAASAPASAPTPIVVRAGFDPDGPLAAGLVDLMIFPAAVGDNELHLAIADRMGGVLPVAEVSAALTAPSAAPDDSRMAAVPLRQIEPGHYLGRLTIPAAGQWRLALTVRTPDGHEDSIAGLITLP